MLKDTVPHDSKVMRYIEQGKVYHSRLKRKYTQLIQEDSEDELTPIEKPQPIRTKLKRKGNIKSLAMTSEEIDFCDIFKTRVGKMNWQVCWQEGVSKDIFKKYGTGEDLRVNYSKAIKKRST